MPQIDPEIFKILFDEAGEGMNVQEFGRKSRVYGEYLLQHCTQILQSYYKYSVERI